MDNGKLVEVVYEDESGNLVKVLITPEGKIQETQSQIGYYEDENGEMKSVRLDNFARKTEYNEYVDKQGKKQLELVFISPDEIINGEFIVPEGVTKIGHTNVDSLGVESGISVLDESGKSILKKLVVPASVEEFGAESFVNSNLEVLEIADGENLLKFATGAFLGNKKLAHINSVRNEMLVEDTTPSRLKEVGNYALLGVALEAIRFEGEEVKLAELSMAFMDNLKSVDFSNTSVEIGNRALQNDKSLEAVSTERTTKRLSIGELAFSGDSSLQLLRGVKEKADSVGRYAFAFTPYREGMEAQSYLGIRNVTKTTLRENPESINKGRNFIERAYEMFLGRENAIDPNIQDSR